MTDSIVKPEPEQIINIEGPKGQSLFYRASSSVVGKGELERFERALQARIDHYEEKYKKTNDDRALALIGALIVEEELDRLLSSWLVDYEKHCRDAIEMTFSFKVKLAKSTRLIPAKILNAIDPVRKIRNTFAHNLDIDTFKQAKEIDALPFRELYFKTKTFMSWNETDDLKTFQQLVTLIALALILYTKHITKVKDHIWNRGNLAGIMKS